MLFIFRCLKIDWFYQVCGNIMCTPPIHFHDWKILLRKYISNEPPDVESNLYKSASQA